MSENGGPAFPRSVWRHALAGDFQTTETDGMTLRDYFAAKAMAMLLLEELDACSGKPKQWDPDIVAQGAYVMADAMLDARGDK